MAETRADTVRQERRMKPGSIVQTGLKLAVEEEKLDRRVYEYRWVSDTPGRVDAMYRQDWDPVTDDVKPDSSGLGTNRTAVVGVDSGKPINGILMRKRKDWYQADQKAKQAPIDELDKAIMRGTNHAESERDLNAVAYTPNGRNEITS